MQSPAQRQPWQLRQPNVALALSSVNCHSSFRGKRNSAHHVDERNAAIADSMHNRKSHVQILQQWTGSVGSPGREWGGGWGRARLAWGWSTRGRAPVQPFHAQHRRAPPCCSTMTSITSPSSMSSCDIHTTCQVCRRNRCAWHCRYAGSSTYAAECQRVRARAEKEVLLKRAGGGGGRGRTSDGV